MLKAARNAAALDELHDANDNRLVRLNLQATVIPDPDNDRALGAVQISITGERSIESIRQYLRDWLRDVNARGEWRVDKSHFKPNASLDALVGSGDFEVVRVGDYLFLLPTLTSSSSRHEVFSPKQLIDAADWQSPEQDDETHFAKLNAEFSTQGAPLELAVSALCKRNTASSLYLNIADARVKSYELIESINASADQRHWDLPVDSPGAKVSRARTYIRNIQKLVRDRTDCKSLITDYAQEDLTWQAESGKAFKRADDVRVYEVGPREQAQQVSTTARSATSLALAASLAGTAPGAGAAANLDAGYRRDVVNRASALDRVPEVVGYSVGGKQTFGWVLGPHATTDEKGRAMMRQVAKPYDLSVDLSVPSWWTALNLHVTTVWAPSRRMLVDGTLTAAVDDKVQPAPSSLIRVPMIAVASDYDNFTRSLAGSTKRPFSLDDVVGGPVNACAATTLFLKGHNLWRAEKVMLLGMMFGREALTIAPDMTGVIVAVPSVPEVMGARAYSEDNKVHVMTPLATDEHTFAYDPTFTVERCSAKSATAVDPKALAITAVSPTSFHIPSKIFIDVTGANLGSIDEVRLESRRGQVTVVKGAKSLKLIFPEELTKGMDAGTAKLEFFTKGKSVGIAQSVKVNRD